MSFDSEQAEAESNTHIEVSSEQLHQDSESGRSYVDDAVYVVEEREAIAASWMWRQLRSVHDAAVQNMFEHHYSSAAVIFAEAVTTLFAVHASQATGNDSKKSSGSPRPTQRTVVRAATQRAIPIASSNADGARRASPRPLQGLVETSPAGPRTSSATRAAMARRGVSATAQQRLSPSVRANDAEVGASPSQLSSTQRMNLTPKPNPRSTISSEIVTIPIRTLTPTRRTGTIPNPASSVKALLEERRRCQERKEVLAKASDLLPTSRTTMSTRTTTSSVAAHSVATTARRDASADGAQEPRSVSARRLSVLHANPVDHGRTMVANRSPMKRRTSPVRRSASGAVSQGDPNEEVGDDDGAIGTGRRSQQMQRSTSNTSKTISPRRIASSVAVASRSASNTQPLSALADPRVPQRSRSQTHSDPAEGIDAAPSKSGKQAPVSARTGSSVTPRTRTSTQRQNSPQSSAPTTMLAVGPDGNVRVVATSLRTPSGRSASLEPAVLSTQDYISHVLKCTFSRSLEVASIADEKTSPFRVQDLLLEVDGKPISTLDHLRLHFESLYRQRAAQAAFAIHHISPNSSLFDAESLVGHTSSATPATHKTAAQTLAEPLTATLSVIRGNDYVEMVLELPPQPSNKSERVASRSRSSSLQAAV